MFRWWDWCIRALLFTVIFCNYHRLLISAFHLLDRSFSNSFDGLGCRLSSGWLLSLLYRWQILRFLLRFLFHCWLRNNTFRLLSTLSWLSNSFGGLRQRLSNWFLRLLNGRYIVRFLFTFFLHYRLFLLSDNSRLFSANCNRLLNGLLNLFLRWWDII